MKKVDAKPLPTRIIDDRIMAAECPLCHEALGLGDEVGSPREQEIKMEDAFGRHMNKRHRENAARP